MNYQYRTRPYIVEMRRFSHRQKYFVRRHGALNEYSENILKIPSLTDLRLTFASQHNIPLNLSLNILKLLKTKTVTPFYDRRVYRDRGLKIMCCCTLRTNLPAP